MAEKSLIKKYGIKLWVTSVKQPNKHPRAKFNFTLLRSNLSSSSESIVSSTEKDKRRAAAEAEVRRDAVDSE